MLYPDKQPNFQQIFLTYGDINEAPINPAWEDLMSLIIDHNYSKIVTFHKWGFLRYYFDQFVQGEISLEQFMTMGDVPIIERVDIEGQIEDQINPHVYQQEHPAVLSSLTPELVSAWDSDTLVVIDPLIATYYEHQYGKIVTDARLVLLK